MPIPAKITRAEYCELASLFFLQFMAMGIWFVPLSAVLDAHGVHAIKPWAFAASALAAFVSPLIFGAVADRHASPVKVLRWLAVASAASMLATAWSIQKHCPPLVVLLLIQTYMLCSVPTSSLSTAIVFSRLGNSRIQFGPVRAAATLGWAGGCWLVSALNADTSTLALFLGAFVWLALSLFTFALPSVDPPESAGPTTWKQRLGWDALILLHKPDHRVVFITAALFSIPLAALLPFTPPHLEFLGFQHISAWMTLAQSMEILSLFIIGGLLLRWRLKWIFAAALTCGVLRCLLCALNSPAGLIAGTTMHGFAFTLYFITAQIYLAERVDPAWQARAQALFLVTTNGLGNLLGYLGTAFWFRACAASRAPWPLFWTGLAMLTAAVLIYFLAAYRGNKIPATANAEPEFI